MINLLSNAIKFTPRGGTITVEAILDGAFAWVTIRDTGVGIAAADLPRMGQPFEQGSNQVKGKPAGTGLGLALSRRLVELHGGTLTIISTVAVGTSIAFTLPTQAEQAAMATKGTAALEKV